MTAVRVHVGQLIDCFPTWAIHVGCNFSSSSPPAVLGRKLWLRPQSIPRTLWSLQLHSQNWCRQPCLIGRTSVAVAFITASSVAADSQPTASLHLRAAGGLHAVRASRRLVVRDACNVGTPHGKSVSLRTQLAHLTHAHADYSCASLLRVDRLPELTIFKISPSTEMHWFMQWSLEQPTSWAMQEAQLPE